MPPLSPQEPVCGLAGLSFVVVVTGLVEANLEPGTHCVVEDDLELVTLQGLELQFNPVSSARVV